MRAFPFDTGPLLQPDIVAQLEAISEAKGKQALYVAAASDKLESLMQVAKIQSVDASNRIEGISTTDKRLRALMDEKTTPGTRSEAEIAGYRDVLALIHESYDDIPPQPRYLLQMHRMLYRYSGGDAGGRWKGVDNFIQETDAQGNQRTRFAPVSAFETPEAMDGLCAAYGQALDGRQGSPLLLCCMFILDFLCIHPFHDGNGRMSRLLTLLLLYRSGYLVGKYISLEKLIENTKDTYYEALQSSSTGWHTGGNDYAPFVRYLLGILVAAYREFIGRVETLRDRDLSRKEQVRAYMEEHLGKMTSRDLMEVFPDIPKSTLQKAVAALVAEGYLKKLGAGSGTAYIRNPDA